MTLYVLFVRTRQVSRVQVQCITVSPAGTTPASSPSTVQVIILAGILNYPTVLHHTRFSNNNMAR